MENKERCESQCENQESRSTRLSVDSAKYFVVKITSLLSSIEIPLSALAAVFYAITRNYEASVIFRRYFPQVWFALILVRC